MSTIAAHCRLIRLHQPTGFLLLLWPTLWAVWLCTQGHPPITQTLLLCLGCWLTRSAGCAINDLADHQFDGHVTRTHNRPLPSGALSRPSAWLSFTLLSAGALGVLSALNPHAWPLAAVAAGLIIIYPFCKRFMAWPQVTLACAFSCAPLIATVSLNRPITWPVILLCMANFFWTIAYDSQYACADQQDDRQLPIHSTALSWGRHTKSLICLNQLLAGICLSVLLATQTSHPLATIAPLLCAQLLFIYQYQLISSNTPSQCLYAFKLNALVGAFILLAWIMGYSVS